MGYVNALMNAVFAALLAPFRGLNHWYGMVAVSLFSAIVLLAVFKVTSNRKAIRRNKNRAVARLLELMLFKDDIVVNIGALGRTMLANAAYMGSMIRPLLFGIVPFALILVQVAVWFSCQPLQPGDTALVKVTLSDSSKASQPDISARGSPGVAVETSPVRIPARNEVVWRIRAGSGESQSVDLLVNGTTERKALAVGTPPCPVSPVRARAGFWNELANPAEPPLPASGPLARIEVAYPAADFVLAGASLHWLLVYIVLTMGLAWALKGSFRVEI